MSKLSEAADAIQQLAERNRGILLVADALTELGSIEQATLEANIRRDAANARLHETSAALEEANSQLGQVRSDADVLLTESVKQSDTMVEEARVEADRIVTQGRADAQNIIDTARRDAANFSAAANGELDALNTKIGEARNILMDTNNRIIDAQSTLASTATSIEAMKETAQKILG